MPVFSRPETILVRRQQDKDNVKYPYMAESSAVISVALPFYDAIVDMTGRSRLVDNIFIKTVIQLLEIKKNDGWKEDRIIDYISKRTCLNNVVIKTIIKKYAENTDIRTGQENTQREYYPAHVMFNPLINDYIIECFDEQTYTEWSYIDPSTIKISYERNELQYGISIGRRGEYAHILGVDDSNNSPYDSLPRPNTRMTARTIELLKNRLQRRIDEEKALGIEDTLQRNPVWVIAHIYVDDNALSDLQLMSPFSKGNSKLLLDQLREKVNQYPQRNAELLAGIKRLETIWNQRLDAAVTFEIIKQETAKKVMAMYPDLKKYPEVAKKVSTFFSRFPEQSGKSDDAMPVWPDKVREEITVSFYSAMEEVFTQAVENLFPRESIPQTEKIHNISSILNSHSDPGRSYKELFSAVALRAGFQDSPVFRDFFDKNRIKARDVSRILKLAEEGTLSKNEQTTDNKRNRYIYPLTELIAAISIEADGNPNHPFRKIAASCPNLFQAMKVSRSYRNVNKHRDMNAVPEVLSVSELYVMKALLEMCIEMISVKVSQEQISERTRILDGKAAAEIKADAQIRNYAFLAGNPATAGLGKDTCFQYFYKDPEYYSTCTNLLDRVLYEALTHWDSESGRSIVKECFTGKGGDDWQTAVALFDKYGCVHEIDATPPDTYQLVDEDSDLHLLSLRNKLMMLFAVFDREYPGLLAVITGSIPDIVELCVQLHVRRGHSNETDFTGDPDELERFHRRVLEVCDQICRLIMEDE